MDHHFEPTRAAALDRIESFLAGSAASYRERRNYVNLRGAHDNVSRLSPYLRYRMITERELVCRVSQALGPEAGRCFIDEVLWRSYWKGHLRHHPSMYLDYQKARNALERTKTEGSERALRGCTGIACFDDWTRELRDTGYLHNHARMWWASIWVFTLKLPWQLGAAFFEEHLVDADPASNTLSWRWVAGLHTPGKIYQAGETNISTYTEQRYPKTPGLELEPKIPSYVRPPPQRDPVQAWGASSDAQSRADGPCGLLVLAHDLHPESQWPEAFGPIAIFDAPRQGDRPAARFQRGAVQDAQRRLQNWAGGQQVPRFEAQAELLAWMQSAQLRRVRISSPPFAQGAAWVPGLVSLLRERRIDLELCERPWDSLSWPHAAKGFFQFRKKARAQLLSLAAEPQSGWLDPAPGS